MNAPDKLVSHDRWFYVECHWPDYNEPVDQIVCYPTGIESNHYNEYLIGQTVTSHRDGLYVTDDGLQLRLIHGGATTPDERYTRREPIPVPARAKQTRYYMGRWEKYTKAHGWETCY